MKIVADTGAWIEFLTQGKLCANFKPYLEKSQHLIVPVLVQYELFKWVCRERDEVTAYEVVALTQKGQVIDIDTSLALLAADVSAQYKLAMADAIIYATALYAKAKLVTSDAHFAELPDVRYFKK